MPRIKKNKWLNRQGLRRCLNCKQIKPLTPEHFGPKKSVKTGFNYYCRPCNAASARIAFNRLDAKLLRLRFLTFQKYRFTCQYCGRSAPEVTLHLDHITPRSKGGKTTYDNLTVACSDCNIGKGDVALAA